MATKTLDEELPSAGDIVRVRSRQYLVEDVVKPPQQADSTLVRLSCLDDDAQGESLEVLWEKELDARCLGKRSWDAIASRGFDDPKYFSAYLNALRWNCVTATNSKLFQAPYRAGIEVKAYQLEPLRKALLMPRVNIFIADDVGLGKTIEAGLILRELLIRQKVRRCVICCPPSVVRQWQEEMEERFGLSFVVYDRDYVATMRQERGYGVNPWTTHSRFIISHALIRDEAYAGPLRDWLGEFSGSSMLILDEAHNVAPASGSQYAIDSKLTKSMRDLAARFEHKLFLSATPHNGHSNSFSSLLEILDPQKFCRGVKVSPQLRDTVMVRRLKSDLRAIGEAFPSRKIVRIVIDGLPQDAPELALSRLLQQYRQAKEKRLHDATTRQRASAMLVVISLQKRLLSSIEAFALTLKVHQDSMRRQSERTAADVAPEQLRLLSSSPGADDDRADLDEEEVQAEENAQMKAATRATMGDLGAMAEELALLDQMTAIANRARHERDSRLQHLIGWIKENLCPDLGKRDANWLDRRVLIFTEYTDTKRYLEQHLKEAIAGSDHDAARIMTFHGGMGDEKREAIKSAFNADPARHPLRILIATEAAREGVNLQNHCADLFHFDVPWNPGRLEQRNGRIDRTLQRAKEVRCHYYVLPQRPEDRVLDVLVTKTDRIHKELGSLSPVIERRVERILKGGIRHDQAAQIALEFQDIDKKSSEDSEMDRTVDEELEQSRETNTKLVKQVETLQTMLAESRDWIGLDDRHFRDALSASLEVLGADGLSPVDARAAAQDQSQARWHIPKLHERMGADPTWAATLDSLRTPRKPGQKLWEWRKEAPIRPVVFRDPGTLDGEVVHLHLEHRIVQRLLGRFVAQGFLHDELTRACIIRSDDPQPRVILLGRLSLYGHGAARLHDEVIVAAAEWHDPANRRDGQLKPLADEGKLEVLRLLDQAMAQPNRRDVPEPLRERLKRFAPQDVLALNAYLEAHATTVASQAVRELKRRGNSEAQGMKQILESQQSRIRITQKKLLEDKRLMINMNLDWQRQLEADQRHWTARLTDLEREILEEPDRVKTTYEVKAQRLEPVGLIYLWPISN